MVPGAVKEGFREEAMPEPSVMSLIQVHLNVSEIVYISLSLALKHTHTQTHTHEYCYFITTPFGFICLIFLIYLQRPLVSIGKNGSVGFPAPQPTYFMGQPIYLIVFHLSFQIWEQKTASRKFSEEDRGRAHASPSPPQPESGAPAVNQVVLSSAQTSSPQACQDLNSPVYPHDNCFHGEHFVS